MNSLHSVDLSLADDARIRGKKASVGAATHNVIIETRAGWVNIYLTDDARRKLRDAVLTPEERKVLEAVHVTLEVVQ